jgi:hypothetical protein
MQGLARLEAVAMMNVDFNADPLLCEKSNLSPLGSCDNTFWGRHVNQLLDCLTRLVSHHRLEQ